MDLADEPIVILGRGARQGSTRECDMLKTHFLDVFQVIGQALNEPIRTDEMLRRTATALVERMGIKACQFKVLGRDRTTLDHVASHGLSDRFLEYGSAATQPGVRGELDGDVVRVDDCASDPRVDQADAFVHEGIVSLLTVPLTTRGQAIGVIRLGMSEGRCFSDEDVELFRVVASFCSSAVTHAMFHQILDHVSQTIRSSLDLDEVLDSIVRVVAEDLRAKGCTIRLLDDKGGQLELRAGYGLSGRYLETASAEPGPGVWKALDGEYVSILDAQSDPRVRHHDEARHERIGSMLFVPLMIRDRAIGVLSIYTNEQYEFSEDETHLMASIGEQCALAIRNAQMYAAVKRRYEVVVDEFHQWFEHYCTHPNQPES
jgi:GAF domain-containing protein